jgi:flagellar hook-basal body complex protein FliE
MVNGVTPQLSLPAQLPREIEGLPQWSLGAPPTASASPSFKEFMLQAIDQVNAMQLDADQSVEQLLTGGDVNPAEVLTAVQKADLSFRMMLQVRNKLVQAFQEIKELRI